MTLTKHAIFTAAIFALLLSNIGCRSRGNEFQTADRIAHCLIAEKSSVIPEGLPANFSLQPSPASRLAVIGCAACPSLPTNLVELYAYRLPLRNTVEIGNEDSGSQDADDSQLIGVPIPLEAWEAIPKSCLKRMFDFQSIRNEAALTEEEFDDDTLLKSSESNAPKLALPDIVDLALLNSRDYQSQKETLYLVALQLAQERFAYTTKFSNSGNGGAVNFSNLRNNGQTVEQLGINSGVQIDRMLATGGDVLASFANNILLTFDGPAGFTSNVSSSILIEFVQPLLQIDVQFESLTQAERDLVYAARDFARFRKGFFVDFASDYYDLIASFRQVEINSQNYFSLVRAFNQAEAEYTAGLVPRVQVDQVEQSLLSGRGSLIGTCNSLEQDLDSLKLASGIPTETPINLNLEELNELTRLDQLSVSANSTNRVLKRLVAATRKPDRAELTSTAAVLLDRLIDALELSKENEANNKQMEAFELQRGKFLIDFARLNAGRVEDDLQKQLSSESPSEPLIFQRSTALCKALLSLAERQLQVARLERGEAIELESKNQKADPVKEAEEAEANDGEPRPLPFEDDKDERDNQSQESDSDNLSLSKTEKYKVEIETLTKQVDQLDAKLLQLIEEETIGKLPDLIDESTAIRIRLAKLVTELDKEFKIEVSDNVNADLERIKGNVLQLIESATTQLNDSSLGLKPINIEMDDAMITAIVLRYDLMNQRGILADDWRQIKLAADELKSVISLQASHQINTPPGDNQPFNFDLDNSTTSLGLTFDAPLNRFSQRNSFRAAIIGYQSSLRNLKLLEDSIKFSVRNDLRSLSLDREQYLISVASAALAYERVVSTLLEFRLGTGGVSARDFLEAQTAYTDALSDVANRHIQYLVDRTQLFFDLELLMVDENGFWNDIRNEDVQPQPQYSIPAWGRPIFGELPNVRYSSTVKQTLCPVNGDAIVGEP